METLLLHLVCEEQNLYIIIGCAGRGIIAAVNFVNIKVLYATERTLKNNNNNK